MLVAFPLAAYPLLLWSFRAGGGGWRASALQAATLWAVSAVLVTELLSLPGWLTPAGLAVAWLVLDVAVAMRLASHLRRRADGWAALDVRHALGRPGGRAGAGRLGAVDLAVLGGAGVVIALVGVTALLSPPNTWDAMQYHMPRVVHWLQNRSVAFYPTHETKQLHMAPGAEFLILQLHALWGGDRLDNLVQWFAYAGSVVGVTLIARSLGAGPRGQALAAVVCATIPQGILEASGAKNDYVVSFWLVALAWSLLRAAREPALSTTLGIGAALGLACLTKATAYLFAPPLLAALWLASPRSARRTLLTHLPVILLLALAVNAGHFARNYALIGAPLGPGAESPSGEFKYANDVFSPSALASNVIRNAALHLGTRDAGANAAIEGWLLGAIRLAGADPNDPRTTWSYTTFHVPRRSRHESTAGNPVHLGLIGLTGVVLAAGWRRADRRPVVLYAAGLLLAFIAFSAVLRWQPWHTRLHLPLFVLWSAATGTVVAWARPAMVAPALGALLLWVGLPIALGNELRPLTRGGEASLLGRDWRDGYFADRHPVAGSYRGAADFVKGTGCRQVGLDLTPGDHYEYPLLALLGAGRGGAEVRHVRVQNTSRRLAPGDFKPCALICDQCLAETLELGATSYRSAWSSGPMRVLLSRGPAAAGQVPAAEFHPHARVTPSGTRFHLGERLTAGVEARNPPGGPGADFLVGIVLPDGRTAVFASDQGTLSGPIPLEAPAAFPRTRPAPAGFAFASQSFLEFTFPTAGEAVGRYKVFAAVVREGALRDNRVDPGDILAIDVREIDVGP